MPKATKTNPPPSTWDTSLQLLSFLATTVSVISFLFYYKSGDFFLYGDAVSHINIARRVFDSKTPGLLQLGTVWLPLPHLLMIPFLLSKRLWQQGVGGSIPSMAGYVFAVLGIFRLTRSALSRSAERDHAAQVAAWTAALIFAANPNLIYMQSTAMGETVYLAFFLWSTVYFVEHMRGDAKALTKCGLCLAAACLTRYDGWLLAAAMAATVLLQSWFPRNQKRKAVPRRAAVKFCLIAAAAPALWLAYNAIVYRNPLEFANGPYSAKAIERKSQSEGNPGHPGSGNPIVAGMYFLKSAEDNVAVNPWLQRAWVLILAAAIIAAFAYRRRSNEGTPQAPPDPHWHPLLFLLIPLPFYALSISYGGVPVFVPTWWPFSFYNVRYGLQLLPAFAVALAALVYIAIRAESWPRYLRLTCAIVPFVLAAASYASVWRATPVSLKEAQINMRKRTQLELELARWFATLPHDATVLMYVGDHVGALERAGVPLRQTINEGNHRVWKQPTDPEGLWERALANPRQYADYVLAFEGDPVWQAVHNLRLPEIVEIHVSGQARAVIYRAR
jgi:hypothetical protein